MPQYIQHNQQNKPLEGLKEGCPQCQDQEEPQQCHVQGQVFLVPLHSGGQ